MADMRKIYPRSGDKKTVYLKNIISNPNIIVASCIIQSVESK